MSGIGGILRFDGAPVSADDVRRMTRTMSHRGPDGSAEWVSGQVGFGHCLRQTSFSSLSEVQPIHLYAADLHFVMDGRLDNRDDLARALGDGHRAESSDPELILRSLERWDLAALRRFVGDFAFALWDGRRRRLVCGRDFLGKRPFYYSHLPHAFRFGSELQAVLEDTSVPREPNEGMAAEFLANAVTSTSDTLFRHVFRLPPAHFLVLTSRGLRVERYWDWDPRTQIRYSDDRQYAEHFLEVCESAVEPMASSPWPLGVSLSGGLDSSSVVGIVERLRNQGRPVARPELFSMVFPGQECDESGYIKAVADLHDLPLHLAEPKPVGSAPYEAQIRKYLDLPDAPNLMMHRESMDQATDAGVRALLFGKGPDGWLAGSPRSLSLHIRKRKIRMVLDELRAGGPSAYSMAVHCWRHGVKPLAPSGLRRLKRRYVLRSGCPAPLTASLCAEVQLESRLQPRFEPWGAAEGEDSAIYLADAHQIHANELAERSLAAAGLESRDPFDDRRVVEFSLALPPEQRRRHGETKFVLRQAMDGLIPEAVRRRSDKAHFSHLFLEEFRVQGGRGLFQALAVVDRGWVSQPRVIAMYDELERGSEMANPAFPHIWQLWAVLSLERWVRALDTKSAL